MGMQLKQTGFMHNKRSLTTLIFSKYAENLRILHKICSACILSAHACAQTNVLDHVNLAPRLANEVDGMGGGGGGS